MQRFLTPFLLVLATAMRECVEPKENWLAVPAAQWGEEDTDEFPLGFRTTVIGSHFNKNTHDPQYPCILLNASKGTKFEIRFESDNINGAETISVKGWQHDRATAATAELDAEGEGKKTVCGQMNDYTQDNTRDAKNKSVSDDMMALMFYCKNCPEDVGIPISYRIRQGPGDDVDREDECIYWEAQDPDSDGPRYPSEIGLANLPPANLPDSARNRKKNIDEREEEVGGEEGNTTITIYLLAIVCVTVAIFTIVVIFQRKGPCKTLRTKLTNKWSHVHGSDGSYDNFEMKQHNLNLDDASVSVSASESDDESIESLEVEVHA